MGTRRYDDPDAEPFGSDDTDRTWKGWVKARKSPLLIAALIVGGLAFAAGWNPPTDTVHKFTEASDYNERRESGCTNSGEGCHGFDERRQDFNRYHPDTECNVCHEYTGVGCIPCHSPSQRDCTGCHDGSMEGAADCLRLGDSYPNGHYREALHEATGSDFKRVMRTVADGKAEATCGDCHSRDLRAAHTSVPEVEGSDYGTEIGCTECHNDEQSGALKQVKTDWERRRCDDCHGKKARSPMHDAKIATELEATGEAGCGTTGDGCHGINNLHALHPDEPATCSGSAEEGEPGCHDLEIQASVPTTTACGTGEGTCHQAYVTDDYSHEEDAKVHVAVSQSSATWTDALSGARITCASCHAMDLDVEHRRAHVGLGRDACLECHNKDENTVRAVRESWPARLTTEACATCHERKHADADAVHMATQLADDGTVSETACTGSGCHASADVRLLHKGAGCTISGCHSSSGAIVGTRMTCGGPDTRTGLSCHANGMRHVGAHDELEAGMSGTKSTSCVACHGKSIFTVSAGQHRLCVCHSYSLATPSNDECADCHTGKYAPHGFTKGRTPDGKGWTPASGHNTTTYGVIGGKTRFDGSQGVTLRWISEMSSPALPATWQVESGFQWAEAPDGWAGRPIEVGDTGTVTTDWEFPTVNVFWRPGDPDAPDDALYLHKDSVVTCEDCHTGLTAPGPHGANGDWGIDPDYPADYSYAELTKLINQYPSGIKIRSSLATGTVTYTSGMKMICSKCHDLQNQNSGTTTNSPLPLYSTGDDPFVHDGMTFDPVRFPATGTQTGWAVFTDVDGRPTGNSGQRWTQALTVGALNTGGVGSSTTAHSSYHQDRSDGSPQCVNCHIGIPHGWKRPRLLVNTGVAAFTGQYEHSVKGDVEPYLDPDRLGVARGNLTLGTPGDYTMPWYNYVDGKWVLTNVTDENTPGAKTWNAAQSTWTWNNSYGWNRVGMLTLSAVDNHPLTAGSPIATPYPTGAAYWSEPSCQGCNDHMGEDGIRIMDD